jgi:hypothetical protein
MKDEEVAQAYRNTMALAMGFKRVLVERGFYVNDKSITFPKSYPTQYEWDSAKIEKTVSNTIKL